MTADHVAGLPGTEEGGGEVPDARALIDGTWIAGDGASVNIVSPGDGTVASRVSYCTPDQVDDAVAAARRAQPEWAAIPVARRAELLHDAADAIAARGEEICRYVVREMGKTIRDARLELITDVTIPLIRAAAEDALRFSGMTRQSANPHATNRKLMTLHEPIGVGAFISPWNFPTEMIFNIAGAIAVGNTAVWKPSEVSPYAPQLVAEAFTSVGIPSGVVNVVYGAGDIGERLVTHPDVGLVAFIGSTATGERIARAAGAKRLLLEMGGNGPLIVMDDADLDKAVEGTVLGCFYQAGQVCTASERILVHESVHDEFAAKLTARAKELVVGDPLDEATDMGPLSGTPVLEKTVRHVEGALAAGAKVLTGGEHDGLYYQPTVLTGVTPEMEIAQEETFGPVAPIIRFSSAEEALQIANESSYGLQSAVYTESLGTAWKLVDGLQTGVVVVNGSTNDWDNNGPFGGIKRSGVGRECGVEALRSFTNIKFVNFILE
jgi:acyl-CoA reductase-like NAD-dependent aldehyde dehydrogenase